jgi:Flp pilus assembly protein TadD
VLTATGNWHHQAIAASHAGRYDEAASLFRRAAEASPGERTILTNLGLALARGGRFTEAIDAYLSALELARSCRHALQTRSSAWADR